MMNHVKIGTVHTFDHVEPSKEQSLKVLEEAAEVFGAWQDWILVVMNEDQFHAEFSKRMLLNECADVIQAVCNLVSALGINDLTPYMQACEERNRKRGRL